jgi:hypothetical protein
MVAGQFPKIPAGSTGRCNTLLICSAYSVFQEDLIFWAVLD